MRCKSVRFSQTRQTLLGGPDVATDKLTWIDFHSRCRGYEWWTMSCDLVSGRVCLASIAERKLRSIDGYLHSAKAELDTLQALLLVRQKTADNAQLHVAQLNAATLKRIESEFPYQLFRSFNSRVRSPECCVIDDTGGFFSRETWKKALNCDTWGIDAKSPPWRLFSLIKRASGLSRDPDWWW